MNWYRITSCPNYAISEDGQQVKNITTDQILNHHTAPYAKDGLRRVTLRRYVDNKIKIYIMRKVYTFVSLKEFINEEFLL